MILQWLAYALAVSALASVAAWLAERGARDQGWPARWVWLGALAVSVGLPVWALLSPSPVAPAPAFMAVPTTLVLESIPPVSAGGGGGGLDGGLIAAVAWAALSVLLLAGIAGLLVRLHRRRRGWSRNRVEGVDVWVSRRTGPAALGVLRGHVVVPEWALSLAPERRRLLVLHEAEHVRARDPQLALIGLVLCALVPWNLPLWWQLRRLRLAIEVDCDERVLQRAGDARGYGSLLLEVCQRKARLALALAESRSMLERRIRMITKTTTGPATLRAIVLAAVAGLVLAVACETPGPTGPADRGAEVIELREVEEAGSALGEGSCEPAVFAYGTWSSVEVIDAMDPADVESIHVFKEDIPTPPEAASCGVIVVLTKDASVDEEASARRLVEELTLARRAAAEVQPSELEAGSVERVFLEEILPPLANVAENIEAEPTFTPMTARPRLRNADAVRAALEAAYPSSLRQGGIGGTTNVWLFIDAEGSVRKIMVNEASDYEAFDRAALEVARTMEFTPAYNREQRVPVWIALDITFQPTE